MDFTENLKRYANVRTLSIAFPSSIFDNTPTPQLEAYLVGQVARAAVVFNVTEIVIFNEENTPESKARQERLVKLFEYAECPQYLRKRLFAIEPDLKYAGLIHPLEAQHHLRKSQLECPYREGVTVRQTQVVQKGNPQDSTEINIGLNRSVVVPGHHELNMRVTVKVDPADLKKMESSMLAQTLAPPLAELVFPVEPLEKLNLYWGYYVRAVDSLSKAIGDNVFCPGKKSFYDLIIGTSERGATVDEVNFVKNPPSKPKSTKNDEVQPSSKKHKPGFNHILVVFGGVRGLEHSASSDKELQSLSQVSSLFDYWINTCPNQGSTTIRTEEAILISLSVIRPKLNL